MKITAREKIRKAALKIFAQKGYDAATTREIAIQAGVKHGLISYYFDSKKELFSDVIGEILNAGLESLIVDIERCNDLLHKTQKEKIEILTSLLNRYIDFIYSENVPRELIVLMIREQLVKGSVYSNVYKPTISIFYDTTMRLVASISQKKVDDNIVIFEVMGIIGRILSFKIVQSSAIKRRPDESFNKEENELIKNFLKKQIAVTLQNFAK